MKWLLGVLLVVGVYGAACCQLRPLFDFQKSLRVDFCLAGGARQVKVLSLRWKSEPHWGGSRTRLIFPDYGTFRVRLIDSSTQKVVFSKGFGSLFTEWEQMTQARKQNRMFWHSLQMPLAIKPLRLQIEKRNRQGQFEILYTQTIHPPFGPPQVVDTSLYTVRKLLDNGHPAHKVDLAIIAEGYTAGEMTKFYADAKRMVDSLFEVSPFDGLRASFNVYAIGVVSAQSGTSLPSQGIFKKTAFGTSLSTFGMDRYLTTNALPTIADVASLVPYDHIFVLVNTKSYGGSGFYNHLNVATADHPLSAKVFVHEFGHGLAGLADEYYNVATAFDALYDTGVEPWERNITALVDFTHKWKDLVKASTPVPTPRTQTYRDVVGAFEGGGYVHRGIYSPAQNCRMKTNSFEKFCPVCQREIRKTVAFYSE